MDPLPPSTTSEVLSGKRLPRLPRLEFVESYVAACLSASGVGEPEIAAEVARWRDLWRSLATPLEEPADTAPADRPSPRRPRALLPLMAVVFAAGLGAGIVGTLGWTGRQLPTADAAIERPTTEAPDVCLPVGAALPAGEDVLRLPPEGEKAGSWWVNESGTATLTTDGRQFEADVTAGTSRPGDVIIVKGDVTLVEGRTYALAFTATADRDTTIRVRVQDSRPPAYHPSYDRELSVSRDACVHLYKFAAARTSAHSELTFQVGGRTEDFHLRIRDASLVALPA